jgi:hypothetical protein
MTDEPPTPEDYDKLFMLVVRTLLDILHGPEAEKMKDDEE